VIEISTSQDMNKITDRHTSQVDVVIV